MKTSDFGWFLPISIIIHTLLLWKLSLTPLREPPSPTVKARPLSDTFSPSSEKTSAPGNQARAQQGKRLPQQGEPFPQEKTDQSKMTGARQEGTSPATGGTAFPDEGTLSTAVGDPSARGGTSAGSGGTSSTTQGESIGTQGGSDATEKTAPTGTQTSAASTPIPEPPQHRYRRYGTYFVEVDHYVIEGMNIPGTNLCIAGDQLRTKGPMTITQPRTDYSKCRIKTRGDEERDICPPEARSEVVVFEGYLTSPISYSVNTCRKYDTSHCRVLRRGTDREREYCNINFKYVVPLLRCSPSVTVFPCDRSTIASKSLFFDACDRCDRLKAVIESKP